MRAHWHVKLIFLTVIVMINNAVGTASDMHSESPPTEQPAIIMAVAPIFPPVAVASNTSGEVIVEVAIDAAGVVTSAHIIDGHPLLRQVLTFEQTAKRWRFASITDSSSTRTVRLTFVLRMMPSGTPAAELTTMFMPPYKVEVRHLPLEPITHSDPPGYVRPPHASKKVRRQ